MKKIAGISFICILIDQIIKLIVSINMNIADSINVIKNFFRITYLQNTGAAFSIFSGNRIFLILITLVALLLIYFILMLGIIVFVHELGHFIWAKASGVYCYEFSLGFGPKLFSFHRKGDETLYCLRLFPLGGYVSMAGEEIDDDKKVFYCMVIFSKTIQNIKWYHIFCCSYYHSFVFFTVFFKYVLY